MWLIGYYCEVFVEPLGSKVFRITTKSAIIIRSTAHSEESETINIINDVSRYYIVDLNDY